MSNLTHILIYLRAFAPSTTYIFPRDRPAAVPKDPAFKYMILFLVSVTAMVIFTVSQFLELQERHQRQQNRLTAFELDVMDMEGRILPEPDLPELYDDGFMLPPPAYELLPALELDMLDVDDRILLEPEPSDLDEDEYFMLDVDDRLLLGSELPDLDEDDDFMLSPPASELLAALELDMLDVVRLLLGQELPDLDEDDDFMLPPPAYEVHENMLWD